MLTGISIKSLIQIVMGIAFLIVGIKGIVQNKRFEKPKTVIDGKVLYSKHFEKKDKQGFYRQFYYEITVEVDEAGRKKKYAMNSMDQYKAGDIVKLVKNPNGSGNYKIFTPINTPVFGQWVIAVIGAFLLFTPAAKAKFGAAYLTALLSPICIFVGLAFVFIYFRENRKKLEEINSEIVGVLKWQKTNLGNDGKYHKSGTALYCPLLKYEDNGVEKIRRSRGNSNVSEVYPIGGSIVFYKDIETGYFLEAKPKSAMLIMGGVLLIVGLLGMASIFVKF